MDPNANGNVGNSPELDPSASANFDDDFSGFQSSMDEFYQEIEQDAAESEETQVEEESEEIKDESVKETESEKESEEPETQIEKPSRTSKFTELQTQVQTLTEEKAALETQVGKIEEITQRYGSFENFVALEEQFLNVLLDPTKTSDAVQLINGLNNGAHIRSEILFDSLGLTLEGTPKNLDEQGFQVALGNQATIINSMLKGFQGIDAKLNGEEIEELGTYLALQLDKDNRAEFLKEIKRQNQVHVDPKDKEIRRLNLELQGKQKAAESSEPETEKDFIQVGLKVANEAKEFHNQTYTQVLTEEKDANLRTLATKYRIDDNDKLPPEIRKANGTLREILAKAAMLELEGSEAQIRLLSHLRTQPKNHPTFPVNSQPYKNALKAKVEGMLRELSPRLNGVSAKPKPGSKEPFSQQNKEVGVKPSTGTGLGNPPANSDDDWSNFNF